MSEELFTPPSSLRLAIDLGITDNNEYINRVNSKIFDRSVGSGGSLTIRADPEYGQIIHFNKAWIYDTEAFAQSPKGKDFLLISRLRGVSGQAAPLRLGSLVGYYKGATLYVPGGMVIANPAGSSWAVIGGVPPSYPSGVSFTDWVEYRASKIGGLFQNTINGYSPYPPQAVASLDTYGEDVPRGIVIGENVYSPSSNWQLASYKLYIGT